MATIDIKLKSYDQLVFEITKLNTDIYLKDMEIARLNKIIDEIEKIVFDKSLHETEYEGIYKCNEKTNMCERYYLLTELRKKIRKLKKELKEEDKE